jgi:hypothetical protein
LVERLGYRLELVETPPEILHFKTECGLLDPRRCSPRPASRRDGLFRAMRVIETAEGEDAAANAIAVNGRVFLSAGHPRTAERLRGGLRVVELPTRRPRWSMGGSAACRCATAERRHDDPLASRRPAQGLSRPAARLADRVHGRGLAIDRGLPLVEAFGPVYQVAGGLLMLAALALIAWSALWFWRKKTTIEPHHTPTALIVEGPYRLSRNPIYLALLMFWWATSAPWGLLGPVILPFAYYMGPHPPLHRAGGGGPEAAFRGRGACISGKAPAAGSRSWSAGGGIGHPGSGLSQTLAKA